MDVVFYEKPGRVNNTRQKALLRSLAHTVVARDLLHEAWAVEGLTGIFADRSTAPRVKSGAVRPDTLDWQAARRRLLKSPLLIRRSLPETLVGRTCGFDKNDPPLRAQASDADLQTCTREVQPCHTERLLP